MLLGAVQTAFEGTIHTGVGSEEEARDFPCPPAETGEASRSGPVVCVPAMEGTWTLESDASGICEEGPAGWRGECIFVLDLGDELRVWGTRGIPPTGFRITWSAPPEPSPSPATTSEPEATPGAGAGPESDDEIPPPEVARSTSGPSETPAASATGEDEEVLVDGSARGDEVPEAAFWDPPVTEVPGYSDLAARQPTFERPQRAGRGDAGAPVAAGVLALVAGGFAAADRRWLRDRPGAAPK